MLLQLIARCGRGNNQDVLPKNLRRLSGANLKGIMQACKAVHLFIESYDRY